MFELTNEQRECFAISPVLEKWQKIRLKPSPYDTEETYAYIDGTKLLKLIKISDTSYCEYDMSEMLSEDGKYLLPKTAKGKPMLLSASMAIKRPAIGMAITFYNGYLNIYNSNTEQDYYRSSYAGDTLKNTEYLAKWVENWRLETTEKDLADIRAFAAEKKQHVKFKEGDFFRFKLNRRLYGYGRILLDFSRMRKEKEPFWDIFMGKPVCACVYHIATERDDVTTDELCGIKTLPSQMVMDNIFYYGECKIIGNKPIAPEEEDFPIHYGTSINAGERKLMYQCGRTFLSLDNTKPLYETNPFFGHFTFNNIGFNLYVRLPVLLKCIETNSNEPYWTQENLAVAVEHDLRNPKNKKQLEEIKKQFKIK